MSSRDRGCTWWHNHTRQPRPREEVLGLTAGVEGEGDQGDLGQADLPGSAAAIVKAWQCASLAVRRPSLAAGQPAIPRQTGVQRENDLMLWYLLSRYHSAD